MYTLTDDVGIFQHAKFSVPDPAEGYTTDDNVRALIVAGMLYEKHADKKYLKLVNRYMSFLVNAQNSKGKFKNFMDYNRNFIEEEGSDDCFGRCIWALGYTASIKTMPDNIKNCCMLLLDAAIPNILNLKFLRSKAYCIIGIYYTLNIEQNKKYKIRFASNKDKLLSIVKKLSSDIMGAYNKNKDLNWNWFEGKLTYSNSIIPWALILSYELLRENDIKETAVQSLKFIDKIYFRKDYFKPIGCKGWLEKGKDAAEFDEQPIEAAEALLMYIAFYNAFGEDTYLKRAEGCFKWYKGKNSKNVCLIDEDSGGCFDGIEKDKINFNQGSESIVSYCMAYLALDKCRDDL